MICINQSVLIACLLMPWWRIPGASLGIYFFATSLSSANLPETGKTCHWVHVPLSVCFWQNSSSQVLLWLRWRSLWYSHQLNQVIQSNCKVFLNPFSFRWQTLLFNIMCLNFVFFLKTECRTCHLITLCKTKNFYFYFLGRPALH